VTTSEELVWLIERLRGARSRRSRLRLLFEAWETVRALRPADRLAVARELGFDGAERLVEEAARRRGLDPAPFVEALGGIERSAGRDVTDVLRGLADPARRTETVDRLVEGAGRWVADVEPLHPQAHQAGGEASVAAPDEGDDEADAWHEEEVPEPVVAATPSPLAKAVAAERAPGGASVSVGPQPAEGGAAGLAAAAPTANAAVAADAVSRPTTAAGPSIDSSAGSVVAKLTAEPRILARLRLLPRLVGELAGAGHEAFIAVLECFPTGWARRRALERLLAAGQPASVTDAIALVEVLVLPSERLWAYTSLAASRPLNRIEREALLAAAPSAALRRRLGRRLARRQGPGASA
jgi:hypothetical protein